MQQTNQEQGTKNKKQRRIVGRRRDAVTPTAWLLSKITAWH
jgi:hypothetical protein